MRPDVESLFLRGRSDMNQPLKALSVRMPPTVFAYLQRLAEEADISRNAMAVQLLSWGIEFALSELPVDFHASIVLEVEGEEAASEVMVNRT
jgi:hypothetical protein